MEGSNIHYNDFWSLRQRQKSMSIVMLLTQKDYYRIFFPTLFSLLFSQLFRLPDCLHSLSISFLVAIEITKANTIVNMSTPIACLQCPCLFLWYELTAMHNCFNCWSTFLSFLSQAWQEANRLFFFVNSHETETHTGKNSVGSKNLHLRNE